MSARDEERHAGVDAAALQRRDRRRPARARRAPPRPRRAAARRAPCRPARSRRCSCTRRRTRRAFACRCRPARRSSFAASSRMVCSTSRLRCASSSKPPQRARPAGSVRALGPAAGRELVEVVAGLAGRVEVRRIDRRRVRDGLAGGARRRRRVRQRRRDERGERGGAERANREPNRVDHQIRHRSLRTIGASSPRTANARAELRHVRERADDAQAVVGVRRRATASWRV